jgi:hypothetical protein
VPALPAARLLAPARQCRACPRCYSTSALARLRREPLARAPARPEPRRQPRRRLLARGRSRQHARAPPLRPCARRGRPAHARAALLGAAARALRRRLEPARLLLQLRAAAARGRSAPGRRRYHRLELRQGREAGEEP